MSGVLPQHLKNKDDERTITLKIVSKSGKNISVADVAHILNALHETYQCFDNEGELKIRLLNQEKTKEEIRAEHLKSPHYMAQYED